MTLDAVTWSRVTEIFERVAELSPAERDRRIEDFAPEAVVREWLDKLLTAHDDPDELLIDRTVKGVVEALADDETPGAEGAPDAPVQLGPWRLVEEIATGGMGRVMLGERCDGRYEQRVAVKLLAGRSRNAADAELLDREIRLLARLEHPGIVRLIDGGLTDSGQPYLVMEYVDGEPIDEWCRRREASLNQRIELLQQVADALSHAHRRLIVHADIKPSNVLVDDNGRVRVLDFGIGELIRERAGPEGRALRCSPAWCAPEQLLGTSGASVAQDVFGLGALMLRLLTGRRVREGSRITRWLGGTISGTTENPASPSTALLQNLPRLRVRGDLDAVCLRALAAEPEARYASVELFDADLRAWKDQRPVAARPLAPPARLARWTRRNRVPVAAVAITLGGLLAGIILANSSARQMQIAADHARVQAERADAVRDFVLDLFRAADPLRAGGAELSTRQVLAGAGEALEHNPGLSSDARLEVLNVLADVQRTLGWTDDAESLLAQAMHLVETDPALAPEARAETHMQLGLAELDQHEFDTALVHLRQAEVELGALETPAAMRVRARAHTQIGSALARMGRGDEAARALDQAEALLATLDPPMLEVELIAAAARGIAAYRRDAYEDALIHLQRVLDIQYALGNQREASVVTSLGNLAAVSAQLGRLEQALEYDRRAVEVALEAYPEGHTTIGRAWYSLSDTLRQTGRFDEALAALDEALEIQQRAGMDAEIELIDLARTRTLFALGRYDQAASVAAVVRPALAQRWGGASREALMTLEVELAARSALPNHSVDMLVAEAAERLSALNEDQRGGSIADLLRWRLAEIELARGRPDRVGYWLDFQRGGAAEPAQPTLVLRRLAVQLRRQAQLGVADPDLEANLTRAMELPGSNADAQAYAWCALAEAAMARARPDGLRIALVELDTLANDSALGAESANMIRMLKETIKE